MTASLLVVYHNLASNATKSLFCCVGGFARNSRQLCRQLSKPPRPPSERVNKIMVLFRLGCCPPFRAPVVLQYGKFYTFCRTPFSICESNAATDRILICLSISFVSLSCPIYEYSILLFTIRKMRSKIAL